MYQFASVPEWYVPILDSYRSYQLLILHENVQWLNVLKGPQNKSLNDQIYIVRRIFKDNERALKRYLLNSLNHFTLYRDAAVNQLGIYRTRHVLSA